MANMYGKVMRNRFEKSLILIRAHAHNSNWKNDVCKQIDHIESIMNQEGLQEAWDYVSQMARLMDQTTHNDMKAMFWNIYWLMSFAQYNVDKFNKMWRTLSVDL